MDKNTEALEKSNDKEIYQSTYTIGKSEYNVTRIFGDKPIKKIIADVVSNQGEFHSREKTKGG